MQEQIEIRNILVEELEAKRLRNPRYSLRAFAKSLGFSPSALSEVLNGKRRLSKELCLKLADKLCLPPDKIANLKLTFEIGTEKAIDMNYLKISADNFRVMSEWYHMAILSLSELEDFESSVTWIANRLNISVKDAEQAIERLLSLGLLIEEEGQWLSTGQPVSTTDHVVNMSLRKSHFKNLELAQRSLEKDDLNERDFTAITMAIDPKKIPEAKKRIREFRDTLSCFLEADAKTEVYKLCMQLFPLTEIKTLSDHGGQK